MTKKELIKALKPYKQDTPVNIGTITHTSPDGQATGYHYCSVERVVYDTYECSPLILIR